MDNFIQGAALRRRPSGRRQGVAPPPGSSRIRLGARRRARSSLAKGYRHRRALPPLQSTTRVECTAAASLGAILYYANPVGAEISIGGDGTFTICTPFLSAFCSVLFLSTWLGAASAASSFPRPLRSAPFAHQRPGAAAAPCRFPRPPCLPRNRRPRRAAAGPWSLSPGWRRRAVPGRLGAIGNSGESG